MRKVTKRLLTICVAALALGACQDNVIFEEPVPPPPPPPLPLVDATVSILGLDMIPGPGSVNPTAVAGDINVSLNVEEGDNTVTAVDLLFNGAPVGCTTINTSTVPGQGVSLSTVGAGSAVIECFWNTDTFDGTCDGSNLPPQFPNGTHTLGAQITLDDGTTRTASNTQQVTLVNSDLLTLVMLPGAQSLVSGGVTYYGGPRDLDGDGTDDNPVDFAICPVSFNGTTVASLALEGLSNSGPDSDIGSGSGVAHLDSAEPFVWTVDPADNDRASGNPVEDISLGGPGGGTDFATTGIILDDGGLNVSTQFAGAAMNDVHLDFTSPLVMAGAEVTIAGASTMVLHYSADAGNAFGLTGVTDAGVGFTFGTGAGSTIAVGDCGAAVNSDGMFSTAFVPVAGFEDVTAVADVTEDDAVLDADTNAEDCYMPEVTALQDDLANATDLSTLPTGAPADATINSMTTWGADFMPSAISALLPDTDPADAPVFVLNDVTFMFDADDPDLVSTDPGSGIEVTGCDGDAGTAFGTGSECTNVTATDGTDTWEVDHDGAGTLTGQVFSVDIADMGGNGSAGPLADGAHTITISVDDNAVPANTSTDDYTIILDTTAPVIGALNPAPVGSAGTDATSIIMSIGETIDDANIISLADLTVAVNGTDAMGAGASASCAAAVAATNLYILDVTAGEIDRNALDLSNGTNAVDFSAALAEAFQITDPFPGTTGTSDLVNYCFLIDAEDEALDKSGAANPNVSALVTQVDVTWTSP